MVFTDFIIKYDPNKDTIEDVTFRIIYVLFNKRLKYKKPAIAFVGGDSGEGKSVSGGLGILNMILKGEGLDLKDYVNDVNVYTPLQYPQKLEKLLYDKRLKKVNAICMHEAREIIRAKMWQRFLTQATGDINAMSRSVKRLCIIIISQFIRDIATDIRYTLNYYITVSRPMGGNRRARLKINKVWKDDRDLEKPKLRKRRISGYLEYPSGKRIRYTPQYLEMKMPPKEVVEIFDKHDFDAKSDIIKQKIDRLIKDMTAEVGVTVKNDKIPTMVDYYINNIETLDLIGKRYRGKFRLKPETVKMHDLTRNEVEMFNEEINKKLKQLEDFEDGKPGDD